MLHRLRQWATCARQPDYLRSQLVLWRISRTPRYRPGHTQLLGGRLEYVDSWSLVWSYREIYDRQIYRFRAACDDPLIIDGGANIGLSVIFFKQLYPKARILAFEPDKMIFDVLARNCRNFGYDDVRLIRKALWTSDEPLQFISEGGDAGRVPRSRDSQSSISVPACRLRDHLNGPVDFLKLDVEGSEFELLCDCADLLSRVRNLFVEYHSFEGEPQTLCELLSIISRAGFRIHMHPFLQSPQPFIRRSVNCGMDFQVNVFGFRE
jgi:FkbM family methyltransferase